MNKLKMRQADLVTSLILMVYGSGMLFFSVQLLTRTLEKHRAWYQSAGLFPLIISIFLLLSAFSLFRTARKAGAKLDFINKETFKTFVIKSETRSTFFIIAWLAVYIYILLPAKWLSYIPATFIFLFVFMMKFNTFTKSAVIKTVIISAVATAMLTYGFGQLAMIPLP